MSTFNMVTTDATTALWVGFAFFTAVTVVLGFLSYTRNVKAEARLTYYLSTLVVAISSLAYLIMALGNATMLGHDNMRAFEWVRYAAWALVAPITVWIFALLAGAHWSSALFASIASIVSLAGFFAAAISSGYNATWPLFAFGAAAGVPVVWAIAFSWQSAAYRVHPEVGKLYTILAYGFAVLALAYVICIGVFEVGNAASVEAELITFATLDGITKSTFTLVLIYARESIARYGSVFGHLNTGMDMDFPIARSTYTSSGSAYATEPSPAVVFGEHRDLAFAQLHGATNTQLTAKAE